MREPVGADAKRLEELLQQDLAGMHGCKFGAHALHSPDSISTIAQLRSNGNILGK